MNMKNILLAVGSFIITATVLHTSDAYAVFGARFHASNCNTSGATYSGTGLHLSNYGWDYGGTGTGSVYCPILDNTDHPKQNITTLNVHGIQRNTVTQTSAAIYSRSWNAESICLGSSVSTSTTGVYTLKPNRGCLGSLYASDFGVLNVSIALGDGTNYSTFYGYYEETPLPD